MLAAASVTPVYYYRANMAYLPIRYGEASTPRPPFVEAPRDLTDRVDLGRGLLGSSGALPETYLPRHC